MPHSNKCTNIEVRDRTLHSPSVSRRTAAAPLLNGRLLSRTIDTGDAIWGALERVVADVKATRARIARLQAHEAALLDDATEIVRAREEERRAGGRRSPHDLPLREVTAELGAAMRLSDRTVQARMSAASALVSSFSETFRALRKGRIDLAHASAITDSGAGIDDPASRAEYERILLEAARFETPARLRAIARVVAARIDPEMAAELQRRAHGTRRVRVIDLDDGMARLLADLPAVLAHAIHDRLTEMAETERDAESARFSESESSGEAGLSGRTARGVQIDSSPGTKAAPAAERLVDGAEEADSAVAAEGLGDPRLCTGPGAEQRTLDELRADIFADLVLAGAPSAHGEGDTLAAIRAQVQIRS
ncbi:DUF222 domain-containing protein [Microbacterium atlanticum]|uniref:DUF222 domain-containing protein n=1 Tax=Microbacterium atlanticum TaxID=2782168 RepID=UPI0018871422|nr:DUF222 domain-containing protein [Microbacterium atlanticum]